MDRAKSPNRDGELGRRSFLGVAGRLAAGGVAVGALFESTSRSGAAWGQQPGSESHSNSAGVVERLMTRLSFQMSVDVGTIELGLTVAGAAVAAGVDIIELGTPLLKTQGVAHVVVPVHSQAELPEVIRALRPAARLASGLDRRQQQSDQHADDGDNN